MKIRTLQKGGKAPGVSLFGTGVGATFCRDALKALEGRELLKLISVLSSSSGRLHAFVAGYGSPIIKRTEIPCLAEHDGGHISMAIVAGSSKERGTQAMLALFNDIPLLLDKPPAMSTKGVIEILEMAKEREVRVAGLSQWLVDEQIQYALSQVHRLGTITRASITCTGYRGPEYFQNPDGSENVRKTTRAYNPGPIGNQFWHPFDVWHKLLRAALGTEKGKSVFAELQATESRGLYKDFEVPDTIQGCGTLSSGLEVSMHFDITTRNAGAQNQMFIIEGENGQMVFELREGATGFTTFKLEGIDAKSELFDHGCDIPNTSGGAGHAHLRLHEAAIAHALASITDESGSNCFDLDIVDAGTTGVLVTSINEACISKEAVVPPDLSEYLW